ncbi:MAG: tetratricopeptide repeat protein [Chloroflexi bacterium]|nr:tetratricopeptide repeat protein [Chloroflexota bacterium]
MTNLATYLPQDRRRALARGENLPDRAHGSVLFADISGFTNLTERLHRLFGSRRGAEELTKYLDAVYTVLIAAVENHGGSVIGFAGDAITCWFEQTDEGWATPTRAVACGLALQSAMRPFLSLPLPETPPATLTLKVAIATGPVRRFAVGNPDAYYLDTLAGATISRMATAEHLADKSEIVVDQATADALGSALSLREWRTDPNTAVPFGVVDTLAGSFPLPAPPAPPPTEPAPTLWRTWMPRAVYEREQAFLTEFRPCVALFVRFEGIDYDRDEAQVQLNVFIEHIQTIAERLEGVLLNLTIGDKGSYAYFNFGALTAHEDDARRAVRLATNIAQTAQGLGFLAPVQIGLTQGVMRVGAYGGPTRRTYSALGDEVNLAARLMQAAVPGEILVTGHIHKNAFHYALFNPRPPLQVKGKSDPISVFALVGERKPQTIRLPEPIYALPMVGRQQELHLIEERLEMAQRGRAQLIGLAAEAGLGKSRLVAEVIRLARPKGFIGYGGACQSDGLNTPYLAWKPIWTAFFELDPSIPLSDQTALLTSKLNQLAPTRLSALPLLNVVLGLEMPENDFTRSLEPKHRRSALTALLEDCLRTAAQVAPILIVLEDLHWLDALSFDLLEALAKTLTSSSICFVMAYRPPQLGRLTTPRLESLPSFTKIELSELTPAEAEQVIRAKLAQLFPTPGREIPAELVQMLMTRTQGNPFYLEELLNYLHDRGLDPRTLHTLSQIELPDSLHSLILSRIDQLTEREKSTLRVASIAGRLFRATWLTGYYPELGALPQVRASLDELHSLDITPLDAPEPELAYLFKHIVTHEVTYESLPFATRAKLHEQLATYIEATYAESPPLEVLAFHYGRSQNLPKQHEYFRLAGEAAQRNFANEAALAYYDKLLPLLEENSAKVSLLLKRGAVLELMGAWAEVEQNYHIALSLAETPTETAAIQGLLGKLCRLRGDYEAALEWLRQAQAGYAHLTSKVGLTQTVIEMGMVYSRKGEYDAAQANLHDGLAWARQAGDNSAISAALNNLGLVANSQGDYASAWALYEESYTLRRELGDKWGMAVMLNNLGSIALNRGEYAKAQKLLTEGLALQRSMGDKLGISMSLNNLGGVATHLGDEATAQTLYEESLVLRRALGDKWGIALLLLNLGLLATDRTQYRVAAERFHESLRLCVEIGSKLLLAINQAGLAELAAVQGQMARAAQLASAAETLLSNINGTLESAERERLNKAIAAARTGLEQADFQAAWTKGAQMELETAVAYALEEPTSHH